MQYSNIENETQFTTFEKLTHGSGRDTTKVTSVLVRFIIMHLLFDNFIFFNSK